MSDEFDTILDQCLADLMTGRATVDSCLRRYPTQAGRLATLLPIAERARAVPRPAPLPVDKRRVLEARLLKTAGQRAVQSTRPVTARLPVWQRRGTFAVMSLVLSVLFLFSAVGVSAASLPGDVLYPIKRAAEQVRTALTPDQAQAALHLELAQVRLHELDALAQRGEVSTELLAEIEAETNAVLERVALLPVEQQQTLLTQMASFQDGQMLVLGRVAALAQNDKQTRVKAALADTAAKRQQVMGLLNRGGDPAHKPGKGPLPTAVGSETQPSPGNSNPAKPTTKPSATARSTVEPKPTKEPKPEETPKPTKAHPATPEKPTPRVDVTPPGQENRPTPNSPPGQEDNPTKEPKPPKEPKK